MSYTYTNAYPYTSGTYSYTHTNAYTNPYTHPWSFSSIVRNHCWFCKLFY
jgi:hypothetical protein